MWSIEAAKMIYTTPVYLVCKCGRNKHINHSIHPSFWFCLLQANNGFAYEYEFSRILNGFKCYRGSTWSCVSILRRAEEDRLKTQAVPWVWESLQQVLTLNFSLRESGCVMCTEIIMSWAVATTLVVRTNDLLWLVHGSNSQNTPVTILEGFNDRSINP